MTMGAITGKLTCLIVFAIGTAMAMGAVPSSMPAADDKDGGMLEQIVRGGKGAPQGLFARAAAAYEVEMTWVTNDLPELGLTPADGCVWNATIRDNRVVLLQVSVFVGKDAGARARLDAAGERVRSWLGEPDMNFGNKELGPRLVWKRPPGEYMLAVFYAPQPSLMVEYKEAPATQPRTGGPQAAPTENDKTMP